MATADSIPVVDFKDVMKEPNLNVSSYTELVNQLHAAFSKVGFVFIKNHGIQRELVSYS